MEHLQHITIVIPVRIDSRERRENLDASLDYIFSRMDIKVLLLEADTNQKYVPEPSCGRLQYYFVEDADPVFYRTRYINRLLGMVETPVAGIWDSDVIVPAGQIAEATEKCLENAVLCYPFDGRFYAAPSAISELYRKTRRPEVLADNENLHWLMHGRYSVGGAFVVNVEKYLAAGGENEYFYGWGPEDTCRRERIYGLGLPVLRVEGSLFHLHHPRGSNSRFAGKERETGNLREYLKICGMNRPELERYVAGWPWLNTSKSISIS
jgi:hypothetical protein